MHLTPHFTTEEFACRDGTPLPRHAYGDARQLARRYLEPLRNVYGPVRIVSGYRTPAYNAQVGGAPHSYHVALEDRWGVAVDLVCQRGGPSQWYRTLELRHPGGLGLYAEHVHVDNRAGFARW